MNILEINKGVVHADCASGDDHTLCGVSASRMLSSVSDYSPEDEDIEIAPCMIYTKRKIDCPECSAIIRHCCKIGRRAIVKGGAQ